MGNCIARPQSQNPETDISRSSPVLPQQRQHGSESNTAAVRRSPDGEACIIVPEAVAVGGPPRSATAEVPKVSRTTPPPPQREVVGGGDSASQDARERESERRAHHVSTGVPRASATPALMSAQPPSARSVLLRARTKLPGVVVAGAGVMSREEEEENDTDHTATPPPSPPLLFLRSPSTAEQRTGGSHASTLTLTDETSQARPESLAMHDGGSSSTRAADVSYGTDGVALDDSAQFTSIPLVEDDGDTIP